MNCVRIEKHNGACWSDYWNLVVFAELIGISERPCKLAVIVEARQAATMMTCTNNTEASIFLQSVIKQNHYIW